MAGRRKELQVVPGTTSKILWHFTGRRKKSDEKAFTILKKILEEGRLKLSQEKVPFKIIKKIFWQRFYSVAEIPIQHLQYHSIRYGRFALGFHRDKLRGDHRFRPVHYVIEPRGKKEDDFLRPAWDALHLFFHHPDIDLKKIDESFSLEWPEPKAGMAFFTLLNLVKFFSTRQFQTVYCEREWRRSEYWGWEGVHKKLRGPHYYSFEQDMQDRKASKSLCMIVCPKKPRDYAANMRKLISENDLLRAKYGHVPIIAFEDLLES